MIGPVLGIGLVVAATGTAHASPLALEERDAMPARAVERSPVLERGWVGFELDWDEKRSRAHWGVDGRRVRWDSERWIWRTGLATLRLGVCSGVELFWRQRLHGAHFSASGSALRSEWSIGDAEFGTRLRLVERDTPRAVLAVELVARSPMGREAPVPLTPAPDLAGFVFTTGTPSVWLAMVGAANVGPLGFTARMGWDHRFGGVVSYELTPDEGTFLGRLAPGHRLVGEVDAAVQLGPVVLGVTPSVGGRLPVRVATTASDRLVRIAGTGGVYADLGYRVVLQVNRGFELQMGGVWAIRGVGSSLFGIEDLHPTAGSRWRLGVGLRF